MAAIGILLVDDQSRLQWGWRAKLDLEPDLGGVGGVGRGVQALALARVTHPDDMAR